MGVKAQVRVIDGQEHRLCNGPAHSEPTWLPLTEKYFYPRRRPNGLQHFRSRCRLCELWRYGDMAHGLVPAGQVRQYFIEGINKVGKMEFARRVGIHHTNLTKIVEGQRANVRKETVRRCLLEIVSIRRKNEVRHRNSILRGTLVRGEPEREVKTVRDLYQPFGDADAETQNRRRKGLSPEKREEIRAYDRARRKRERISQAV